MRTPHLQGHELVPVFQDVAIPLCKTLSLGLEEVLRSGDKHHRGGSLLATCDTKGRDFHKPNNFNQLSLAKRTVRLSSSVFQESTTSPTLFAWTSEGACKKRYGKRGFRHGQGLNWTTVASVTLKTTGRRAST